MNTHKPIAKFKDTLSQAVLNSLSAHIAILDAEGFIVETNRAWNRFAAQADPHKRTRIGDNYLDVCARAVDDGIEDAGRVSDGIRAVIDGRLEEFLHDYPCHSPTGRHWFYIRAIRVVGQDRNYVVVSHEEITALKLTEEALRHSTVELEKQRQEVEEANIALKILLRQREADRTELEQKVLTNIKELVFPYLQKLKSAPLRSKDKHLLDLIETHLLAIISPMLKQLGHVNIFLTPQEMQVAAMVKEGKPSKEIAQILNVAETTVHFHRKNLRQKFGLKNKVGNLRAYLLSLS